MGNFNYEAVLFDVDGTILDTSSGILHSVKDAIIKYSLPMPDDAELLKFIGPPMEWSMESHFGITGEKLKEVVGYFRERYANYNLMEATPYEGIYDLFAFLKSNGIPTAIATYKKQDYAERICRGFGFGEYTDLIYGSDYEGKLTKADIIDLCIEKLSASTRDRILMVGDSKHDANGALKAGVKFCGVSYGFGFGALGGEDVNEWPNVGYFDKPMDIAQLFAKMV